MEILSKLFTLGRNRKLKICPDQAIGRKVEIGPNSSRAPKGEAAKHSYVNVILENLLVNQNVSAIYTDKNTERCYVEVPSSTTILPHAGYVDNFGIEGTSLQGKLHAMYLYALNTDNVMFNETKESFSDVISNLDIYGEVSQTVMALACSCFYYDMKEWLSPGHSSSIEFDMSSFSAELNQSIRLGEFKPANKMCPVSTDFEFVTYEGGAIARPKKKDEDFFKRCQEGGYRFDESLFAGQPVPLETLDTYVSNTAFEQLVKITHHKLSKVAENINAGKSGKEAIGSDYLNTILVGKPGTGKTTLAEAMSAALGLPIYTIPVTKNTEEDTFSGMTKVNGEGFSFVSTPFLDAFENGGIIVIEEFNLADPGVLQGSIGQAIVPPFLMLKDGYMPVYRHPMCVVVLTMNTGTQGSREPNEALASRAPLVMVMEDPDPATFISILAKKSDNPEASEKVHMMYTRLIEHLKTEAAGSEDLPLSITMRHCIEALDLVKAGFTIKEAAEKTFFGALAIKDLEIQRTAVEAVLETFPDI